MQEKTMNLRMVMITGFFAIVTAIIALAQPFVARLADTFFPTSTPIATITQIPTPFGSAVGFIESVNYEQNFVENGEEGLRINMKFSVQNLENIPCVAGAHFQYSSGEMLKDTNNRYYAVGGQVGTFQDFQPVQIFQGYKDFLLFIPYSEFELSPGSYDLRVRVSLFTYSTRAIFAESEYYYFRYDQK